MRAEEARESGGTDGGPLAVGRAPGAGATETVARTAAAVHVPEEVRQGRVREGEIRPTGR